MPLAPTSVPPGDSKNTSDPAEKIGELLLTNTPVIPPGWTASTTAFVSCPILIKLLYDCKLCVVVPPS